MLTKFYSCKKWVLQAGGLWGGAGQRAVGLGRMGQNPKKFLFE
jgi:hypothetical protein